MRSYVWSAENSRDLVLDFNSDVNA
jgi:hypothetical protein